MNKGNILKNRLMSILKKDAYGLSIAELAIISRLSRFRITMELARLEGANKINFRQIGMAKVYYLMGENGCENQ